MKDTFEPYEEYEHFPQWLGWLLIIALSDAVIGWAMVLHLSIPDLPRRWDFGAVPDVPAESIYSTYPSPPPLSEQPPPQQVPPLPEGEPWNPALHPPRSTILERYP